MILLGSESSVYPQEVLIPVLSWENNVAKTKAGWQNLAVSSSVLRLTLWICFSA